MPIGEHYESCPIIAAYVTSYGRSLLFNYCDIAGNNNVYYVDTDSLFVNEVGYRNLKRNNCINPYEIGKLKLESSDKQCIFFGPKDYLFNAKRKQKGIRQDAIKIGDSEYMQNQFEGLSSILKRGGEPFIKISWIIKCVSNMYTKGRTTKSGRILNFKFKDNELIN
jgi:hypothetical protein